MRRTHENPIRFSATGAESSALLHFHGLVTSPDGRLHGGHFFARGDPFHATFEVPIQEVLGVAFTCEMDAEVEVPLIEPTLDGGRD